MTAPSPGWYPHPDAPASLRWWDGSGWTDFVTELPPVAAAAEVPAAEVPAAEAPVAEVPAAEVPAAEAPAEPEPEPEPAPVEPLRLAPEPPAPEPAPAPVLPLPSAPPADPLPPAAAAVATPPSAPVPPPAARRRRGPLVAGAAVVAAAGVAAALALTGGDAAKDSARHGGRPALDRACLRLWNGTDTPEAGALRDTARQFRGGAFARVVRVAPLPGTLMQPGSCAFEAYDPETDTHMIAVAGVKDQVGYLDVTAYPRASAYGWPTSKSQSNVRVAVDGGLRAILR